MRGTIHAVGHIPPSRALRGRHSIQTNTLSDGWRFGLPMRTDLGALPNLTSWRNFVSVTRATAVTSAGMNGDCGAACPSGERAEYMCGQSPIVKMHPIPNGSPCPEHRTAVCSYGLGKWLSAQHWFAPNCTSECQTIEALAATTAGASLFRVAPDLNSRKRRHRPQAVPRPSSLQGRTWIVIARVGPIEHETGRTAFFLRPCVPQVNGLTEPV